MGLLDQYDKAKLYAAGLLGQLNSYVDANTPRATRPVASPARVINEGLVNPNKYNAVAANRFKDSAFGLLGVIPGADAPVGFIQGADYFNRGEPLAGAVSVASGVLPFVPPTAAGLFTLAKVADKIGTPLPAGPARNQAGAIVYHGSPHKFDKFDMSKIGTGEGAQAYGHGLYFAESPAVADSYAGMLAPNPRLFKNGEPFTANKYAEMLADSRAAGAGSLDEAIRRTKGTLQDFPQNGRRVGVLEASGLSVDHAGHGLDVKQERDILAALFRLKRQGYEVEKGGNLYKVDIPDEAIPRMLDWDKPLSEQAPEVLVAVQKALGPIPEEKLGGMYVQPNSLELSQKLREAGIPGIRYLDGSSRNAGQGTSNFVLFDDQLARIIERNGQPTGLLPWQEGEWLNLKSK